MTLREIVPMLASADLDRSVAFYRDNLGFALGDKFESRGEMVWCEMKRDGRRLMFTRHGINPKVPAAREGFAQTSINLYVDDVEALHDRLTGQGVKVSELRVTFYGMKEFDLTDPSGYTVLVGAPTSEPPSDAGGRERPPF